ncbi:MAG: hypothetical protein ACRDT4_26935 [Micromonosporaceae bacterium]
MNDALERRYRRLLAWYPAPHRRAYEEEMVGVLMASARPQQRFPDPREALSLLGSALRQRLGAQRTGLADPSWVDAAAAFGLLAAMLLCVERVRTVLASTRQWLLWGDQMAVDAYPNALLQAGPLVLGWLLVTIAAVAGWRRLAAGLAWATVLTQLLVLGTALASEPQYVLSRTVVVVLGIVAAAALTVPAAPQRGLAVLGRWSVAAFAAASLAAMLLVPAVYAIGPGDSALAWYLLTRWTDIAVVCVLPVAAVVAYRLDPAVRRRLVALAAPAVAQLAMIRWGGGQYAVSYAQTGSPVLVADWQLVALGVVPVLVFAVAVALVHWRDRTVRLLALGRAADRDLAATPERP